MKREEALSLIKEHVKNKNSIKHMLALEAVMRALAERFGEDKDKWGVAGLLHDIDMEMVDYRNEPQKHGVLGAQILREKGVDEDIINATLAHNEESGKERESKIEKAIYAADPLTGLIVASVLVLPSKKINDINTRSIQKRFKEKAFAKGANREVIASCSEIGIDLNDFIEIGLNAMQEISDELEL